MNEKIKKVMVVAVIIGLLLLLLRGCGTATTGQPAEGNEAITLHFADADKNPIQSVGQKSSFVQVQGGNAYQDVFYVYMDVNVQHQGVYPIKVRVDSMKAYSNATGSIKLVDQTVINNMLTGWGCILNNQVTLSTTSQSYKWSPYTCGGDKAWVDMTQFEILPQPILFQFNLKGEWTDIWGLLHITNKPAEIVMTVAQQDFQLASFLANVEFMGEDYLQECNTSSTRPCPGSEFSESACLNVRQSCISGLWAGCSFLLYQNNPGGKLYTGSSEFTGNSNWKTVCRDVIDNDCDGLKDAADSDCPSCDLKFRTSAVFASNEDDVEAKYAGQWIAVDKNQDGKLESYGAAIASNHVVTIPKDGSNNYLCPTTYTRITSTPLLKNPVCSADYNDMVRIYFPNACGTGCHRYIPFDPAGAGRCKIGDTSYPACLNLRPTAPWSITLGQESCVVY